MLPSFVNFNATTAIHNVQTTTIRQQGTHLSLGNLRRRTRNNPHNRGETQPQNASRGSPSGSDFLHNDEEEEVARHTWPKSSVEINVNLTDRFVFGDESIMPQTSTDMVGQRPQELKLANFRHGRPVFESNLSLNTFDGLFVDD